MEDLYHYDLYADSRWIPIIYEVVGKDSVNDANKILYNKQRKLTKLMTD